MAVGSVLRNQRVLYSILDIEGETFCFLKILEYYYHRVHVLPILLSFCDL